VASALDDEAGLPTTTKARPLPLPGVAWFLRLWKLPWSLVRNHPAVAWRGADAPVRVLQMGLIGSGSGPGHRFPKGRSLE
jgi:hypothetical protein